MAEQKFEVVLVDASAPKKPKTTTERATPKWEQIGIKVRKYMLHPTCPFCGMEDMGKESPERPDRNHMISCLKRTMDPYPIVRVPIIDQEGKKTGDFEERGRVGDFVGERITRQLRFPVRLIRVIENPILDDGGNPTEEVDRRFLCSYRWKVEDVHDWVWNGRKWVEWYNWGRKSAGGADDVEFGERE